MSKLSNKKHFQRDDCMIIVNGQDKHYYRQDLSQKSNQLAVKTRKVIKLMHLLGHCKMLLPFNTFQSFLKPFISQKCHPKLHSKNSFHIPFLNH